MTFEEFQAEVTKRWPGKRWAFEDGHGSMRAYHHALTVSWREEVGWVVHRCLEAHGHTLDAAVKHARNAINRARKALDKETA